MCLCAYAFGRNAWTSYLSPSFCLWSQENFFCTSNESCQQQTVHLDMTVAAAAVGHRTACHHQCWLHDASSYRWECLLQNLMLIMAIAFNDYVKLWCVNVSVYCKWYFSIKHAAHRALTSSHHSVCPTTSQSASLPACFKEADRQTDGRTDHSSSLVVVMYTCCSDMTMTYYWYEY